MTKNYSKRAIHGLAHADFYAFTMAQALFNDGQHQTPTCFHAFARQTPFGGGYIVTAGQSEFLNWLLYGWQDNIDALVEFLAQQKNIKNDALFSADFLQMVAESKVGLTIHALPEGSLAFANTPIIRVFGPVWQCLLVEAFLLNAINGQSIIATVASRIRYAADFNNPAAPSQIIEGGIRRSLDVGGLAPSLAAYIGGIDATSNVAAGIEYDIPVRGTFSHAFVSFYSDDSLPSNAEAQAFYHYMRSYPDGAVILVDSYDTLQGVKHACQISRQHGFNLQGIRIDSGDLAYFSKQARQILDEYGFQHSKIAASNNLDPHVIYSLRQEQQACIDIWLVGTHLVVASEQPSLGCVYKLGQVYEKTAKSLMDAGRKVLKISAEQEKTTIPGALELIRFIDDEGDFIGDMLMDIADSPYYIAGDDPTQYCLKNEITSVNLASTNLRKIFAKGHRLELPLQLMIENGVLKTELITAKDSRNHAIRSLARLDDAHKRLTYPHRYITGIEQKLHENQQQMVERIISQTV